MLRDADTLVDSFYHGLRQAKNKVAIFQRNFVKQYVPALQHPLVVATPFRILGFPMRNILGNIIMTTLPLTAISDKEMSAVAASMPTASMMTSMAPTPK